MYQREDKSHLWKGRKDARPCEYIYQIVKETSIEKIEKSSGYGIIGFQSDEGIRRNLGRIGAKDGPDSLRAALASIALKNELSLYDLGDIVCDDNDLELAQDHLKEAVQKIIHANLIPVVLGGGHETAWGHYQGLDLAYQKKESIAIINFDAHLDLRSLVDHKLGSSGTPFYQISEYLKKDNRAFDYYCMGVQPFANTKPLFDYANDHQVNIHFAESINKKPYDIEIIKNIVKKHKKTYVSVCLDVFKSSIAPGVSAPQVLGIDSIFVLEALKYLSKSGCVVGIDVVELSPKYDIDSHTAKLGASLLGAFLMP